MMEKLEFTAEIDPVRSKLEPYPYYGEVKVNGIAVLHLAVQAYNISEAREKLINEFSNRLGAAMVRV